MQVINAASLYSFEAVLDMYESDKLRRLARQKNTPEVKLVKLILERGLTELTGELPENRS